MSEFENKGNRDVVFSKRVRAGKRVYFFDVKSTRNADLYLIITESKKKPGESEDQPIFEKHKIFVYREDFEKFYDGIKESLEFINQNQSAIPTYRENGNTADSATQPFNDIEFDDLGKQ